MRNALKILSDEDGAMPFWKSGLLGGALLYWALGGTIILVACGILIFATLIDTTSKKPGEPGGTDYESVVVDFLSEFGTNRQEAIAKYCDEAEPEAGLEPGPSGLPRSSNLSTADSFTYIEYKEDRQNVYDAYLKNGSTIKAATIEGTVTAKENGNETQFACSFQLRKSEKGWKIVEIYRHQQISSSSTLLETALHYV